MNLKKKLKYPDGTKKAKLQAAMGTDKDKGRNQSGVPYGSETWKKLQASDAAAQRRFERMPEQQRVTAVNQASSSATKKAAIEATGNAKTTNKKLQTFSDTANKKEEKLKEADKKKTTKATAFKKKGAKMLKGKC